MTELESSFQRFAEEFDRQTQALKNADTRIKSLETELKTSRKNYEDASKALKSVTFEREHLSNICNVRGKEIERLARMVSSRGQEIDNLEYQIRSLQAEKLDLKTQLELLFVGFANADFLDQNGDVVELLGILCKEDCARTDDKRIFETRDAI